VSANPKFAVPIFGDLMSEVAKAHPKWPWLLGVCKPSGILIDSTDGPIARVTRARSVRDYEIHGMEVDIWSHSNAVGGPGLLFEGHCKTWAEGVCMVEDWLDAVPLWGTPQKIEWTGILKS
jgi:hypothetical protein